MSLKMYQEKKQSGIQGVKYILAIVSGKGGVGKSTLSAALAITLKSKGFNVGVLDADLYGPSMEVLLPKDTTAEQNEDGITPASSKGIRLVSMAYLKSEGSAAVIRAPIANQLLNQFLNKVKWGNLDFLLIDFPPGTGDIQLTLAQQAPITGAVLVTQPQKLSLVDVEKAQDMLRVLNIPVLGLVENMTYLLGSQGEKIDLFPKAQKSKSLDEVDVLATLALDPQLCQLCDEGDLWGMSESTKSFAEDLDKLADSLLSKLGERVNGKTHIQIEGPHHFLITWEDGKQQLFRFSEVQEKCTCSYCKENTVEVDSSVGALSIKKLGNYAIQLAFTSGCDKGIYSFDQLRQLGRNLQQEGV
ncbi:Uncharacterized protein AB751O23_BH_00010 [Chlamydiales bacterium SCGC AB-751-O23]|jgi:ATP-binding protein involved in chromosome partitioning|nr:Uncharacterized protein AB751O23_BH_00010 [Chlamydiales bacterium SCGC AB-751-O23]